MMTLNLKWLLSVVALASCASALGGNVALGKPVSLTGAFGVPIEFVYGHGTLAPASTITDGIFHPEHSYWSSDSVWWEADDPSGQSIDIDLQGNKSIVGFLVQADDNDDYYLTGDSGWICDVAFAGGGGLITRSITLPTPVVTSHLHLFAYPGVISGHDSSFACTEIQAFDDAVPPVPEPATFLPLAAGALALTRRRKR